MRLPSGRSSGARNFSGKRGSPLSTTVKRARASSAAAHSRRSSFKTAGFISWASSTNSTGRRSEVAMCSEPLGEQPERDRFAEPRLAGDECEAALARQVLDAPAEVLELGGDE